MRIYILKHNSKWAICLKNRHVFQLPMTNGTWREPSNHIISLPLLRIIFRVHEMWFVITSLVLHQQPRLWRPAFEDKGPIFIDRAMGNSSNWGIKFGLTNFLCILFRIQPLDQVQEKTFQRICKISQISAPAQVHQPWFHAEFENLMDHKSFVKVLQLVILETMLPKRLGFLCFILKFLLIS